MILSAKGTYGMCLSKGSDLLNRRGRSSMVWAGEPGGVVGSGPS